MSPLPALIPLFPLPNVVLFPRTPLPLHIFEPRYRRMVADALETDRMIGMVLLKEGWEEDYYGNPPIHPVGCIGKITQARQLEDGRFNILLQGLYPFEVREEVTVHGYRRARVLYRNGAGPRSLPPELRKELDRVLSGYLNRLQEESPTTSLFKTTLEDEGRVQTLSSLLPFTLVEKQFLLESDDLVQQCKRLLDLLQFFTLAADQPEKEEGNGPR
jgi:Lon protease-like protein